jgi:hypothetical protein
MDTEKRGPIRSDTKNNVQSDADINKYGPIRGGQKEKGPIKGADPKNNVQSEVDIKK